MGMLVGTCPAGPPPEVAGPCSAGLLRGRLPVTGLEVTVIRTSESVTLFIMFQERSLFGLLTTYLNKISVECVNTTPDFL